MGPESGNENISKGVECCKIETSLCIMPSLMSEEERVKKSGVNQPLGEPRFWAEKNTNHHSFRIFQAGDDEVFRIREY